jgi:hypothetical protein
MTVALTSPPALWISKQLEQNVIKILNQLGMELSLYRDKD